MGTAPRRVTRELAVRHRIPGYEILAPLGRGGTGTVYEARELEGGRVIALKIIHEVLSQDPGFVKAFLREVRAAAMLDHPNIISAYDFGEHKGLLYFAMELVEGVTIAQAVAKYGPLAEAPSLDVTARIAGAIEHASQRGIIHRDIKPQNIVVTVAGVPKLLDLGLARCPQAVTDGVVRGTPKYVSPEQARDEPDIDVRADIYSLGATLFFMVTGEPPFTGGKQEVIQKKLTRPPPSPLQVNPQLSLGCTRLIQKMMATDPARRHQRAFEVAADVSRVLAETDSRGEILTFEDLQPVNEDR